VPYEIVQ